jgi:branched-subunit amino acid ABC-type transport system permease component
VLVQERESSIAYLLAILTAALGFYYYAHYRWDRREENAREVARYCLVLGSISFVVYIWLIFTAFAEWTVTYNQFLFTGLVRGAIFSLYAIGLTLVYKILKLSNFAQAELFTVGGYAGLYFFNTYFFPGGYSDWTSLLIISFAVAFFVSGFTGIATDLFAFKPLRARKGTPLILMIASVGLGMLLRGAIQFFAGPDVRKYRLPPPPVAEFACHGTGTSRDCVRLFNTEIISAVIIVLLIVVIHFMLTRTDFGRTLRALSDNKELAEVSGINTDRSIMYLWLLSGGLTGLGGAVFAAVTPSGMIPFIGFFTLLLIFAAVIIGTIGHVYGAIIGAFIVGIVDSVGAGIFTLVSSQPNGPGEYLYSGFRSAGLGGAGYGGAGALIAALGLVLFVLGFMILRYIGPLARVPLAGAPRAAVWLVMLLAGILLLLWGLVAAAGPILPVLSSEYSKVAVMVALILVLLIKPQGIFSKYA